MDKIMKVCESIANITDKELQEFEKLARITYDNHRLHILRNLRRVRNTIKKQ